MGKNACWLENDNPYGKSYNNRGQPCDNYGTTDFIVAFTILGLLGLTLVVLGVGWVVRYSRNAARFSRFWNQAPVDDYELKQHRMGLLKRGETDDASSIRSKHTLAPPSTSTRNGRSPLSTYGVPQQEVNPRDRDYVSTGYGDGGRGAAPDFPSGGSNQFYPGSPGAPPRQGGNQPWNNFPAGPSTSQVNLHAGGREDHGGQRDERLGFLNQSAMNSSASFNPHDDRGVGGRLPEMERYNPNQYSPQLAYQHPPPGGQPRYGDPYGGR